ncbi:MAG: hypothetical protein PHC43_00185 [Candidatus Marinimicrobia bacterium]|jgi:hypothetical protein|nr:hypothetical protein [Candidatus Neomarinimicrobiota bacterium]
MAINWLEDVGAPVAVTAIDIGTRASTVSVLGQPLADLVTYAMFAGGYLAASMNWGGRYNGFLKNMGIAAAPLALDKIYTKIRGGSTAARVSRMSRISRYPAPAAESPFGGVRLV